MAGKLPIYLSDAFTYRVVDVRAEVKVSGGATTITVRTPFKGITDYLKDKSLDELKGWVKTQIDKLLQQVLPDFGDLKKWAKDEFEEWSSASRIGLQFASNKLVVSEIELWVTIEVGYKVRYFDDDGQYTDWQDETFEFEYRLAAADSRDMNISVLSPEAATDMRKVMSNLLIEARKKLDGGALKTAAEAALRAWLGGQYIIMPNLP